MNRLFSFIIAAYLHLLASSSPATVDSNYKNCGIKPPPPVNSRIVGGHEAVPHEWPWVVSLGWNDSLRQYHHYCTGSIIAEQWVLTAGHCKYLNISSRAPLVVVGAHNVSYKATEPHKDYVPIERFIQHPEFSYAGKLHNDIALVKLKRPISLKPTDLGSVCIPPQNTTYNPYAKRTEVAFAGWGYTVSKVDSSTPDALMGARLHIATMDYCRRRYGIQDKQLANTMICTRDFKLSPCSGDSGGALMLKQAGRWTVIGLESWGGDKCENYPSMYTHVSLYTDWIFKTIQENS